MDGHGYRVLLNSRCNDDARQLMPGGVAILFAWGHPSTKIFKDGQFIRTVCVRRYGKECDGFAVGRPRRLLLLPEEMVRFRFASVPHRGFACLLLLFVCDLSRGVDVHLSLFPTWTVAQAFGLPSFLLCIGLVSGQAFQAVLCIRRCTAYICSIQRFFASCAVLGSDQGTQ